MSSKDTGGPAFPTDRKTGMAILTEDGSMCCEVIREGGMTLRDWFAAQALTHDKLCTGWAPDHQLDAWFGKGCSGITERQVIVKQAYAFADAMLAERQK